MTLLITPSGCRKMALALALAAPGLAAAQQGTPVAQALASFAAKAKMQNRLSAADVAAPYVSSSYYDASTGLTHTYLQQRVNGLVVYNATGAVHTDQNGKVVFFSQDFVAGAAALAASATPAISAEKAIESAARSLALPRPVALHRVVEARAADGIVFNKGGISENDIPVRLMYVRVNDKLVLVWNVTIAQLDQQHHWNARIDAQTGKLVGQNDYVVSERSTFNQQVLETQARRQQMPSTKPAAKRTVLGTLGTPNSLTVIPVPFENPDVSPRVVVPFSSVNPLYSPYGWQVGEGKAPSGFFADSYSLLSSGKQLTRGNNVAAYDDNGTTTSGSGNLSSTTNSPDGGQALSFDFPFDQTKGARNPDNLAAGTTNLFYWNNMLHDVMMSKGFNEVSGNFQYKNLTGLGAGSDFVRAETQDGSGRNNANFSTPPDGTSGRMQMYLFDNTQANKLTITAPSAAAGSYRFGTASFGPSVRTLANGLCGDIVAVNDGVSPDGGISSCASPYVNAAAMVGKIALIKRGGCSAPATNNFTDKVKFAQANGAVGAIIYDSNAAGTNPLSPGGADASVTIPVIGISGVDGARIKAALANNAVGTGCAITGPDFDGAFDNGVVSHEFGHGISTRLTGGPANSSCLDNTTGNQTMGEGWSDFFGLWMTTRPGDVGSTSRYVATYDNGNPYATGPGFRRKMYSTDFTKNSYIYSQLGTATTTAGAPSGKYDETHDVGEVWATVLWDLNWQFIYKYGYNADFMATTGGNNKMLKLVLDGCKLQVCNPGFLDGRDALLRADSVTNRAANADLIWNVFARRGMGYSAVQGDRVNGAPRVTGIKDGFDLPPTSKVIILGSTNGVATRGALEAYPNPASDLITVRTQLSSTNAMQVAVLDMMGKIVVRSISVPAARMQQNGVELNTSSLAAGLYVVRVTTNEGIYTTKVTIQH